MKKTCEWCGRTFTLKHPNQKYCCRKHKQKGKMEKTRLRFQKYYRKHKRIIQEEKKYKDLGSGSLRGKARKNFQEEYEKILKEKRRLGLIQRCSKSVIPNNE